MAADAITRSGPERPTKRSPGNSNANPTDSQLSRYVPEPWSLGGPCRRRRGHPVPGRPSWPVRAQVQIQLAVGEPVGDLVCPVHREGGPAHGRAAGDHRDHGRPGRVSGGDQAVEAAPQAVDERVPGHHLSGVDQQRRQHRTLSRLARVDDLTAGPELNRTRQPLLNPTSRAGDTIGPSDDAPANIGVRGQPTPHSWLPNLATNADATVSQQRPGTVVVAACRRHIGPEGS